MYIEVYGDVGGGRGRKNKIVPLLKKGKNKKSVGGGRSRQVQHY